MFGGKDIKWKTLIHNGVVFPPLYRPHGIGIKYMGVSYPLNSVAEEYISYYIEPRYDAYRDKRFKKNFFNDWKKLLSSDLKKIIRNFDLCDFSDIKQHVLNSKTKEEKKDLTAYSIAVVDGVEQSIDNYIIERPTIFIGRGDHPHIGCIKLRIYPENVILNVGRDMAVPVPDIGDGITHKWKKVIRDNTLEWIASWQNNVTKKYNYARFGRKSSFKMKSDQKKFDLAKKLKKNIKKIRQENEKNLESSDEQLKQMAVALYLIDRLAVRVGNEKGEDQADTIGISTLKSKNIKFPSDNKIHLDFLGKDSIRYTNTVKVSDLVYNNLVNFTKNKQPNDFVFNLINSDDINRYIKTFMKKLTSKVFRTYNASNLMQKELDGLDSSKQQTLQDILHHYNMALLKVAKLCNHVKNVSKKSSDTIKTIKEKINSLKKMIKTSKNKKKLKDKIKQLTKKKKEKEHGKNLSCNTSKQNYIDPRIIISFIKKHNMINNIKSFLSTAQQTNFKWALDVDPSYHF